MLMVLLTAGLMAGALLTRWAWLRCSATLRGRRREELQFEEVGVVSQLTIHPLKSARGIPVETGRATRFGLACGPLEDRSFLVVTSEGRFVTGRQAGALMTVEVEVTYSTLKLKMKGEEDVEVDLRKAKEAGRVIETRIWGQAARGIDCGEEAAAWLSRALFRGQRLVRLLHRGDVLWDRPSLKPRYFEFPQFRASDRIFYADTSSFLVASESSLEDLNGRLEEPVSMGWFRPNVVVRGARPFDEDDWAFLKIGDVVLRRVKPCERCLLTTIDPTTGRRSPRKEPLHTLQQYRTPTHPPRLSKIWSKKPVFGVNMTTDSEGVVSVGDRVMIARASKHPEYAI